MMMRCLISGLCVAFTISCAKARPKPQPGPSIRITFVGLVAFVPETEPGNFRVLLPDARKEVTVSRCPPESPCAQQVQIPSHAAYINLDDDDDHERWPLADNEIVITPINPRLVTASAINYVGVLTSLLPGIGINSNLTSPNATAAQLDPVVARFQLTGGRIEIPNSLQLSGPEKFIAIQGNELRCPPRPPPPPALVPECPPSTMARAIRYVIEADGAKIERIRFSNDNTRVVMDEKTLEGAAYVSVYNMPTTDHEAVKIDGLRADTHFYWYYELANTPPAPINRFIPLFKTLTAGELPEGTVGGGPRCMMARF